MAYKAEILLGRITKVHGYEGAVTVRLENRFKENLPEMESVFLEIEGKPVPFFISEFEYQGADILRLKFEDYDSQEKVSEFVGCRVFLTTKDIQESSSQTSINLSGFRIYGKHNILIGTVTEITENRGRYLLNITAESGRNILIPLHDDLITRVDKRKKIIHMDLPEGLTEIN